MSFTVAKILRVLKRINLITSIVPSFTVAKILRVLKPQIKVLKTTDIFYLIIKLISFHTKNYTLVDYEALPELE